MSGGAMTPQRDFARLLKPRAIAVVGASADISRIGGQPIPVLVESGFGGVKIVRQELRHLYTGNG